MDTQNTQTDNQPTATLPTTSFKKHVNDDNATFLANLKDRFTEFVNTRMDEHKTRLVSKTPWTSIWELRSILVFFVKNPWSGKTGFYVYLCLSTTKLYLIDGVISLPTMEEIMPSIRYDLNGEEKDESLFLLS
ncbi:hypothetical protein F2Q68_00002122 [Brassica cretica]|uniref:Uncharacterized protein n=1 Tax=Brassica cretica TaxID=69181 RepID=A0A8S9JKP3_BRACR|nr:hypothetical protein F2Q68_00002122 [Brassica cretica]